MDRELERKDGKERRAWLSETPNLFFFIFKKWASLQGVNTGKLRKNTQKKLFDTDIIEKRKKPETMVILIIIMTTATIL